MVHSTGEEKTLGIDQEIIEFLAIPIPAIFFENILDQMPHRKVPSAELIPCNVTAQFGRLREMVCELLMSEFEVIPTGDLKTHYLYVSELVNQCFHDVKIRDINEILLYLFFIRIKRDACQ